MGKKKILKVLKVAFPTIEEEEDSDDDRNEC